MTRALIIGGGIAGTVAAIALGKAGLEPVVFEAYDRTADGVGAFLTLAKNGLDALDAIGLRGVVEEAGFATPGMRFFNGAGRELGEVRMPARTVVRSDLYVALRDEAVRRGIRIEYGKRLVDVGDGVRARFADGTSATGDLLIGADGLRSRVREIIDPRAPKARYIPLLNTGGFAEGVRVDEPVGVWHMIFGNRQFFAYLRRHDEKVLWFANPPRKTEPTPDELAAISDERWRAELIGRARADRGLAASIIEATPVLFRPWATYDFPSVPTWHRDRMVIIGDAAHAAAPSSGQGASMALEDAVTLAKCLRDAEVEEAFRRYERARRERVEKVVAAGKHAGDGKIAGPFMRTVRDFFVSRGLRNDDPDAMNWMFEHHIQWDAAVASRD
ncbi:FAD-dependent monooxygenase [Amycolatopsis taiwanensis]|uniref:FAD-dependent oxidoreductase n=1 Tax=Amycolatopsis taiwanensis TaxID=342230 RepID=A0A9W6R442_9PSEU|nr:FAD-dependent monooxygenase [Amycolatopsis taiwanensis]GLY67292.1 FAD-dependent oxidoreductase [Amycolatopsis taiwanensis]